TSFSSLHSFPTRRSSDLREDTCQGAAATQRNAGVGFSSFRFPFPGTLFLASGMSCGSRSLLFGQRAVCHVFAQATDGDTPPYARSEEHTSELQSRFDLVC